MNPVHTQNNYRVFGNCIPYPISPPQLQIRQWEVHLQPASQRWVSRCYWRYFSGDIIGDTPITY